ncbi:hypothetical protein [Nocardioides sp. SR21]|uniref:hypothetical protein n=1 Tax=Nocardioides sp. SR21 TaxID=2919501 RepID=UPI001FAB2A49|nr:hypothetical protein [Nocardioides sp. SR21]
MRIIALLSGALLLAATVPGVVAPATATAAACPAEVLELPAPSWATDTWAVAMNDEGWVVGTAVEEDAGGTRRDIRHITLWRDGEAPLDLGRQRKGLGPGKRLTREPVAVNDDGVVLIARTIWRWHTQSEYTGWLRVGSSGELWKHGTTTWLKGTGTRKFAWVTDINDDGLVVGYLTDGYMHPYPRLSTQPVVWRRGVLERLPLPPSARGDWRAGGGEAVAVNNHGLIVGEVGPGGRAGWWRLDGGNGSLRKLGEHVIHETDLVDDRGRIFGHRPGHVLWPSTQGRPRELVPGFDIAAVTADGRYVVGNGFVDRSGDRDDGPSIATTGNPMRTAQLPVPSGSDSSGAADVGRGVTAYAPQGGVTVAGSLVREAPRTYTAALWTCAQTYLP